MSGTDESVPQIVRRHLDALTAEPPAADAELFVRVLETLRDLCLDLPEMALGRDGEMVERVVRVANQMILGLLYHLADAGASRAGLEELQQQVEARVRELHGKLEEVAAWKHRLRILDADLDTLREERRLLEAIVGYEQVREQFQTQQRDQAAYQQLLASAAHHATREQGMLDDLARQVEELLAKQRQLLQKELQAEEAAWQAVHEEVFGA